MAIASFNRLALIANWSLCIWIGLCITASGASALDVAYCGGYADRAVAQTKTFQSKVCRDIGNPQWWSTVRDYHLNWCKTLPDNKLAEKGKVDRDAILAGCQVVARDEVLCSELRKQDIVPAVCGNLDFARGKTLGEACRVVRHNERLRRIEQAAAQSSRDMLQQMQSDLDNFLIKKDEDYAWKIGVSLTFFTTGLWAGAAMEAAGYSFASQLATGMLLSSMEEQVEQARWGAMIDAFAKFDWNDGVTSDAALAVLEEGYQRKLIQEFSKSEAIIAAEKHAKEIAVAVKPMFVTLDLFRRAYSIFATEQTLSYDEVFTLLWQINSELGTLNGSFDRATNERKVMLYELKQSGCE